MDSKKNFRNNPIPTLDELDRHYDPDFTRYMNENALSMIIHRYFRARMIGLENLPPRRAGDKPRIFYSNHSGMAFPWDGMAFGSLYWELHHFRPEAALRALAAPVLSSTRIMNPYLIDNLWKKAGGVDATMENFEGLMKYGRQDVLIYPEGVPGIGKGFDRRYQVQQFSTSFIRMAIKYRAEIVPYYTINAEYLHPFAYKNDRLNALVQKLGIPMLPLSPITMLVPLAPFLFYIGLPARLTFVIGKPFTVHDRFAGRDPDGLTRAEVVAIRDEVQANFQRGLTENVAAYGQDPFEVGELLRNILLHPEEALYFLPSGWPLLLIEEYREYYKGLKLGIEKTIGNFIGGLLQNPFAAAFTTPLLGWPMVFLSEGSLRDTRAKASIPVRKTAGIQEMWFSQGTYTGPDRRVQTVSVATERRARA